MKTVRILQGTPARRLSPEAETKVKKFGSWFIQFSQFTYIRVAGCTACPKRLPRYPPDRIVLMELARQLEQYDKMMKLKGETGVTFSLMIGNDSCPNSVAFTAAGKELEQYHLAWYKARQGFDPNDLIKASHGDPFKHIPTLEDFWANAQDDFHVRKLAFSRLSVGMMRAIRWKNLDISNQLEEDEDVLREDYNTVEGTKLNVVELDDHQDPSLEVVTRAAELHTEWWYNRKFRQLQSRKVHLTYEKMKPEEEAPAESVGQGGGSGQQQQVVRNKKRSLEVEKDKEHQEPPAKKQCTMPSRESIVEARSQEVGTSEQRTVVEVSSGSESSGYSNSTEYSPLSENQYKEDMTVTSGEGDRPIDVEALSVEGGSQAPNVVGDALLVEPNADLGRCIAPLWLRQMLMPRR